MSGCSKSSMMHGRAFTAVSAGPDHGARDLGSHRTDHVEHGRPSRVRRVRAAEEPTQTTFVTPDEANLQVGFVVYPAGGEIARHEHRPVERTISGTSEVLVIRSGSCELDVYDDARTLVATRELRQGDVMVMVGGGHGFRLTETTVLLEVKQVPTWGRTRRSASDPRQRACPFRRELSERPSASLPAGSRRRGAS